MHSLIIRSVAAAGAPVPLAALLAWWLVGRSLRPIRRITDAARRASANRLSERIALTGRRDEVTELVRCGAGPPQAAAAFWTRAQAWFHHRGITVEAS